ncbi:Transmembrane protein 68 [Boothiomyces sp. JEL0866]|nr:Transmembrane protein 68 [Boothiomyces sp. JEL0866]
MTLVDDYIALVMSYAYQFPSMAKKIWDFNVAVTQEINKLSPRVKQNIFKAIEILGNASLKTIEQMRKVYPSVMKIGTRPIEAWKQPHTLILHPLAYFVTFWFPVQDQWESTENGDRIIYVGNQQVYGLGTLSFVAAVYFKTGRLVRVVTEGFHFTIPVWKHFLEYFGAIDATRVNAIDLACQSGHTLLLYPGGIKEFLKKANVQKYDLDFKEKHLLTVTRILQNHEYTAVPFGNIGASDMVKVLFNIPVNPQDMQKTVPIIMPISYQRQYIHFGNPVTSKDLSRPIYLPLVVGCTNSRDDALEHQKREGEARYLLQTIHKGVVLIQTYFLRDDGIIMQTSKAGQRVIKQTAVTGAKQVLQYFQDGPKIEQIS